VRRPVRFSDGAATVLAEDVKVFLEIGPQATLLGLTRFCWQAAGKQGAPKWLDSLHSNGSDYQVLFNSLAGLYTIGQTIDWAGFAKGFAGRKTALPTYPFQRQRYWLPPADYTTSDRFEVAQRAAHPLLGQRILAAAASELVQFETEMSAEQPSYLGDHRIWNSVVFPGAGFLEMAAAVGQEFDGRIQLDVEDVVFERAIALQDGETRIVQLALAPEAAGRRCKLYSRPATTDNHLDNQRPSWVLHAKAAVVEADADADVAPAAPDLEELQGQFEDEVSNSATTR
jgi:acyl transferase domain-containing protein